MPSRGGHGVPISPSAPGEQSARTTAPTAPRGNSSPTTTPGRGSTAGTRTAWRVSATSHRTGAWPWRCGTVLTPSSRNACSGCPVPRGTTARTSRNTGGTSTARLPIPGTPGGITTRSGHTHTTSSSPKTGGGRGPRLSTNWSTPGSSTTAGTGWSPSTTPRQGRTTCSCGSPSRTPGRTRQRCISCRRCGSATPGPGGRPTMASQSCVGRTAMWSGSTTGPAGWCSPATAHRICCSVRTRRIPRVSSTTPREFAFPRTASTTTSSTAQRRSTRPSKAPRLRSTIG